MADPNENPDRSTARDLHRLLVVNQVAGPLTVELLSDLSARGVQCRVVTGWVDQPAGERIAFEVLPAPPLRKAPAWRRLWTWLTFTLRAAWLIVSRRERALLVTTNPPLMPLVMPLLKRLFGCRYVLLVYDIYPEVAERMGHLRPGGPVARFWRRLSRRAMLTAQGVMALGEHMAETLRGHLRPGDACDIEVIPNWADTDAIRPLPKERNPFARRHGLTGKFVVLYSGSFGATHDTESIIAAAERLADLPDVQFLLIGGGTRRREVQRLLAERGPGNVTLLGFQPRETLPYSLASADCAIVMLDEPYKGLSVPSKTYYALAAGSAVLAVSPPETELTDLVAEHGCGVHVPPRSPDALADAVRRLHDDPARLERFRRAARDAAESLYSRALATDRYHRSLRRLLGRAETKGSAEPGR